MAFDSSGVVLYAVSERIAKNSGPEFLVHQRFQKWRGGRTGQ
jgi:hypothetical protein